MAENKHTLSDLYQMQSLPLSAKIRMTVYRIRQWVEEYGTDGVYVSFSGGKDSTVLLDIVRNECGYKDIPAVFVDVPTQYPELRDFAKTFDNVEIIRPKVSFMEVCEKYGFPLISKEVSECVSGARKYLTKLSDEIASVQTDRQTTEIPYRYYYDKVTGNGKYRIKANTPNNAELLEEYHLKSIRGGNDTYTITKQTEFLGLADGLSKKKFTRGGKTTSTVSCEELASILNKRMKEKSGGQNQRLAIMLGWLTKDKTEPIAANIPNEDRSQFSQTKYKFFLEAPFEISNRCCNTMKKDPAHEYHRRTGRNPITATMADESRLRTQKWIQNGCNGFHLSIPTSNPMSFWTEQDVLQYIYERKLPICSVYGEVVEDFNKEGKIEGQISLWENDKPILKTTGCKRTGCMLCGFGCHMKDDNRFLQLKETHPKMYGLLDVCKNNGVTFREAIEWTNEHGNLNIRL